MTENPKQTNDTDETDDTRQKAKRDERKVEWAFDFANFGESVRQVLGSLAGEEQVQEGEFIAARGEAESASIEVKFSVGEATLNTLASDSDNLLEADVRYVGEMEFTSEGEQYKSIQLKQKMGKVSSRPLQQGLRALADKQDLFWNVNVSPSIPLALDIDGGVGKTSVDLTNATLTSLDIDTGVGSLSLTLPAQETKYDVSIDSGVGETRVYIPQGAQVMLDIDAGVGSVDIILPPDAAVQVQAEGGLGSVNMPARFVRKSKKQDFMNTSGLWQTEGYDLADERITIYYDGGVGQFTIRDAEII